ncbi:phage portal protein [Heyndrickxia sporothermodurans]|uniref:phage portal protein n=1 Tax=Heyndrickxia sporothermodurans TaxID=46224 RepID=UPI002E1B09D0
MSAPDMDALLFSPYQQALGDETWARMQRQIRYYQYYEGKQHVDPRTGQLVKATELPRPAGLDYDPTRYATNYFKAFIKRKARWQMGGQHGISVAPKQLDNVVDMVKPDYKPSEAQEAENKRSEGYEKLLYKLWRENKMREKLLQAARDRLIAGRVGCKIIFNANTGRIKWVFRPDNEIVPVYSDDDFEELIAVHFLNEKEIDGEVRIQKQTFSLEAGVCYLEEAIYNTDLSLYRTITEKQSMELDFIPVVLFPITDLSGENGINTEVDDMKEQTDILNTMNEDAIDSLKFEMFPMTAFMNVAPGTTDGVEIAPGASVEARGANDGVSPDIKKIESGFRWKEAFKDQYSRVKASLHEITGLPQIVPQELNFGGLNGEALHVLFHDIIQETEKHWLSWGPRLEELHEKTIRYLQARVDRPTFAYDKEVVRAIGDDYDNEIKFVLPLPDNRKELVELLIEETSAGFESIAGAMNRLGVENTNAKKMEVENERSAKRQAQDPYNEVTE